MKKYIPNFLTVLRILCVGIYLTFFCYEYYIAASIVFLFSGMTDILDGLLARKYQWISTFGKIADPIADKLFQLALLITLATVEAAPLLILLLFLLKELTQLILGALMHSHRNVTVVSRWYGKYTAFYFNNLMGFRLFFYALHDPFPRRLWWVLWILAGVGLLATLIGYITDYAKMAKEIASSASNLDKDEGF